MFKSILKNQIVKFENQNDYDAGYLHQLLDSSSGLAFRFNFVNLISNFRKHTSIEVMYAAKFGSLMAEDCGPCLQLVVQFAIAEGVDRKLIDKMIKRSPDLDKNLSLAWNLGYEVAKNEGKEAKFCRRSPIHLGSSSPCRIIRSNCGRQNISCC